MLKEGSCPWRTLDPTTFPGAGTIRRMLCSVMAVLVMGAWSVAIRAGYRLTTLGGSDVYGIDVGRRLHLPIGVFIALQHVLSWTGT